MLTNRARNAILYINMNAQEKEMYLLTKRVIKLENVKKVVKDPNHKIADVKKRLRELEEVNEEELELRNIEKERELFKMGEPQPTPSFFTRWFK